MKTYHHIPGVFSSTWQHIWTQTQYTTSELAIIEIVCTLLIYSAGDCRIDKMYAWLIIQKRSWWEYFCNFGKICLKINTPRQCWLVYVKHICSNFIRKTGSVRPVADRLSYLNFYHLPRFAYENGVWLWRASGDYWCLGGSRPRWPSCGCIF